MEQSNIRDFFSINNTDCELKEIQKRAMLEFESLFCENSIRNFKYEMEEFIGVRGKYEDKFNTVVSFYFFYNDFKFNLHVYYDQLEYYISKEGKTIKECNLEDFWEDDVMIKKYINYLKKDLKKLKIPFNE